MGDKASLGAAEGSSQALDPSGVGTFRFALRVLGGVMALVVLAAGAGLLWAFIGRATGMLRILVAVGMGLLIAWFGVGYFRQLGNPPPADPEPIAVDPRLKLTYLCEMCGLELAVVKAAKERSPKHCGEDMVLTRRS